MAIGDPPGWNYGGWWPGQYVPTTTSPHTWVSSRSTSTLPAEAWYYTWREAVEFASRLGTPSRIRKDGERWHVTWRYQPVLVNGGRAG